MKNDPQVHAPDMWDALLGALSRAPEAGMLVCWRTF